MHFAQLHFMRSYKTSVPNINKQGETMNISSLWPATAYFTANTKSISWCLMVLGILCPYLWRACSDGRLFEICHSKHFGVHGTTSNMSDVMACDSMSNSVQQVQEQARHLNINTRRSLPTLSFSQMSSVWLWQRTIRLDYGKKEDTKKTQMTLKL